MMDNELADFRIISYLQEALAKYSTVKQMS